CRAARRYVRCSPRRARGEPRARRPALSSSHDPPNLALTVNVNIARHARDRAHVRQRHGARASNAQSQTVGSVNVTINVKAAVGILVNGEISILRADAKLNS